MTREEALYKVKGYLTDIIPMKNYSEVEEIIKALEQQPTTKNDLEIVMDAMEYRTNALIENIKSEIINFANAHCSGDDINVYDVLKVIDDCCKAENSITKNNLGVDCIDRAEVLKLMKDNWHTHNGDWAMQESMDDIRALPSVTPKIEPRKGYWIDTNTFDKKYKALYMCSNCRVYYTEGKPMDFNYCPNCGADMRGSENECDS